jgi:hypothetical protein
MVTTESKYDFGVEESDQLPYVGFWRQAWRIVYRVYALTGLTSCCCGVDLDLLEREECMLLRVERAQTTRLRVAGSYNLDSLSVAMALSAARGNPVNDDGDKILWEDEEVSEEDEGDFGERLNVGNAVEQGPQDNRRRPTVTILDRASEEVVNAIASKVRQLPHRGLPGRVKAADCVARVVLSKVRLLEQRQRDDRTMGGEKAKRPSRGRKRLVVIEQRAVVDPAIVAGVKLAVVAKIGHRPDGEANRLVVETVARRVMLERKIHPETQAMYLERVVDAYFLANNYNAGAGWYRRKLQGWRKWIAGTSGVTSTPTMA